MAGPWNQPAVDTEEREGRSWCCGWGRKECHLEPEFLDQVGSRGQIAMRTGDLGPSPWQRPQEANLRWGDGWILEAITRNQDFAGGGVVVGAGVGGVGLCI